jgi:branched-subunit amino acid ABC-type transport system permease component
VPEAVVHLVAGKAAAVGPTDTLSALEFNAAVFWPAIINGVCTAGLYGMIAVAMVLSYRISRTVAFLHGGLVMGGTLLFWYLCSPNENTGTAPGVNSTLIGGSSSYFGRRPEWPMWPTIFGLMAVGALIAALYGVVVTSSKMSSYPKVTQTNFSLALMMILVGLLFQYNKALSQPAASPFGSGKFHIGIQVVTIHQLMTLIILAVIVVGFTILLQQTGSGSTCGRSRTTSRPASWSGSPSARSAPRCTPSPGRSPRWVGCCWATTSAPTPPRSCSCSCGR